MHRVIVVHSNQDYKSDDTPFPPIGAIGSIVQEEGEHGELEIEMMRESLKTDNNNTIFIPYGAQDTSAAQMRMYQK